MDEYAGRVLADRYRLPVPPPGGQDEPLETRAFDTYSGQEVRVRQVPLPEFVDAEVLDDPHAAPAPHGTAGATRRPAEPVVRRAVEAAQAAAQIPDHPLLDQVFDVFAEAGSLWIVSEHVAARPLSALLAEGPLNPYRAAEIGADVLTALRALHAHGWVHRNITARTVLVCDDGRVLLTGLAAGAAEEALCGYAPVPDQDETGFLAPAAPRQELFGPFEPEEGYGDGTELYEAEVYEGEESEGEEEYGGGEEYGQGEEYEAGEYESWGAAPEQYSVTEDDPGTHSTPDTHSGPDDDPDPGPGPDADADSGPGPDLPYGADPYGRAALSPVRPRPGAPALPGTPPEPPGADVRAARAGAIAAYRAATRAAAARLGDTGALPAPRPAAPPPEPPAPPVPPAGPDPQWWARVAEDEDDDEDDGDEPYPGPRPPRVMLKGTWSDGPHVSRDSAAPVPAGGGTARPGAGLPALPSGYTAATPAEPVPAPRTEPDPWSGPRSAPGGTPGGERYRGPETRLAAERARQTRIAVVGAVTERWAPEQAGPVHENWRLAPPIGPATDLWALGALLYRAVQGHAPYPEDSAAELVQLVCAEPPAFAEECGPLRPVVESLLRQDPTERPDFEELRGWLRSLVRSAPEPDVGLGAVPLPSFDEKRLPVVRRRGELVRRWRRGGAAAGRHRHRRAKAAPATAPAPAPAPARATAPAPPPRASASVPVPEREPEDFGAEIPQRPVRGGGPRPARTGSPRSLGLRLLLLILLLLAGGVGYAVVALPGNGETPTGPSGATGAPTAPAATPTAPPSGATTSPAPPTASRPAPSASSAPPPAATGPSAPALAGGYAVREDPEGFRVGVPRDWRRSPVNDAGQVRYTGGDFTLIVVPGRDTVRDHGSDPLEYQNSRERELAPYRASSWAEAERTRRVDIGRTPTAEGTFTWLDSTGREVFVRNLALIDGGRYHVVQVIGPESERDKVSEIYEQAVKAFRPSR